MQLYYDRKEHKAEIYEMYQEIFQDPESFAQYYFKEVYPKNQVLLAENKGNLKGMIHLNPYQIKMGRQKFHLNYIVAVAVKKECRRQGIMAAMLKRCLNDMARDGQPFTYLMPANRAYYEPFDFVFVMNWKENKISGKAAEQQGEIVPVKNDEYEEATQYLQKFMQDYGVYTIPNEEYLKRTDLECKSSGGRFQTWKKDGKLKGVFAEGFEDNEVYLRLAFSDEPKQMLHQIQGQYCNKSIEITGGNLLEGEVTPKIMARITSLTAWETILEGEKEFCFQVYVEDSLIPENQGAFQFEYQDGKMKISRLAKKNGIPTISIGDLTQVFFGYDTEYILKEHKYLQNIIPVGPVYISEEV